MAVFESPFAPDCSREAEAKKEGCHAAGIMGCASVNSESPEMVLVKQDVPISSSLWELAREVETEGQA